MHGLESHLSTLIFQFKEFSLKVENSPIKDIQVKSEWEIEGMRFRAEGLYIIDGEWSEKECWPLTFSGPTREN